MIEYAPSAIYPSPLCKAIECLSLAVTDCIIRALEAPSNGMELTEDLVRHFRVDQARVRGDRVASPSWGAYDETVRYEVAVRTTGRRRFRDGQRRCDDGALFGLK